MLLMSIVIIIAVAVISIIDPTVHNPLYPIPVPQQSSVLLLVAE